MRSNVVDYDCCRVRGSRGAMKIYSELLKIEEREITRKVMRRMSEPSTTSVHYC